MDRRLAMMDAAMFERVVEVLLPPQVPMLSIVGFGEPTLHPRLAEMIAYVRRRRPEVIVKLTTNGSRLTPDLIERLYAAGLDLMEISVVGTDPQSYTHAMGGLQLSGVMAAVEHLNRGNHRYLLATFPVNGASPGDLRAYWGALGARHVEVKAFHHRGGYLAAAAMPPTVALGAYRPRAITDVPPEAPSELPVDACHKLYMFLHVNVRGNLVPCVQEINDRNVLANIHDVSGFQDVVRLLRSHRPVFDICRGCELRGQDQIDYYTRFMTSYFPEKVDRLLPSPGAVSGAGQ
jgi:MoaA/NifB/PqqE/SkfB family radical SAM enzyme